MYINTSEEIVMKRKIIRIDLVILSFKLIWWYCCWPLYNSRGQYSHRMGQSYDGYGIYDDYVNFGGKLW